jgi:hypothetical protein
MLLPDEHAALEGEEGRKRTPLKLKLRVVMTGYKQTVIGPVQWKSKTQNEKEKKRKREKKQTVCGAHTR